VKQLTRPERLRAAIAREPVDRVPYAVWRHFPRVDRSPAGLAQATLRFHERYSSDFLKITPRAGAAVEAWGCVESDEVDADGHRPCASCAVRAPADWRRIRPLDPATAPGYAEQLETIIRMGFDRRIGDAPVVPTIFSPLAIARKLARGRLAADLREHPDLVTSALEAITETIIRFGDLVLREGMSGIFYSITAASRSVSTAEDYARFGEPYDRRVLQALRPRSRLTIVHAHGDALMFEPLARLPADVWNWDTHRTAPSLADGRASVPGAVLGGLDQWTALHEGSPEEAVVQARAALAATGGLGLIIGAGCVLPPGTPDGPLAAVIRMLGGPLRPLPGVAL
jgi:uroporphyrinogen decarboxylase